MLGSSCISIIHRTQTRTAVSSQILTLRQPHRVTSGRTRTMGLWTWVGDPFARADTRGTIGLSSHNPTGLLQRAQKLTAKSQGEGKAQHVTVTHPFGDQARSCLTWLRRPIYSAHSLCVPSLLAVYILSSDLYGTYCVGLFNAQLSPRSVCAVSYTHLTLPTNHRV